MYFVIAKQILIMFILLGIGSYICHKKFISENTISELIKININLFIPGLIFYSLMTQLDIKLLKMSWYMPFVGIAVILLGSLLGLLFSLPFNISSIQRRTFIYLNAFNNYTFLAIPLIYSLFKEKGLAILFLHNFGCTFLYWSFGIYLLKWEKEKIKRFNWKLFINPSFIVLLVCILLVLLDIKKFFINSIIVDVAGILGQAVIPVVILIVGAMLYNINFAKQPYKKMFIILTGIRLIVMPLLVWYISGLLGIPVLFKQIIFIISAMPSASSSPIMVSMYGGDKEMAVSGVFITTLLSLITVPLLVWLFF